MEKARDALWGGLLPLEIRMVESEIASSHQPFPLYVLVPRMGYLGCLVEHLLDHFGDAAVPSPLPTVWLEDAQRKQPLRWHLPIGVLFDLLPSQMLPWRMFVHFDRFPEGLIPSIAGETDVRRHWANSFKQGIYLQNGHPKVATSLSLDQLKQLWEGVRLGDRQVFESALPAEVNNETMQDEDTLRVPVRIMLPDASLRQPLILPYRDKAEREDVSELSKSEEGKVPVTVREVCLAVLEEAKDEGELAVTGTGSSTTTPPSNTPSTLSWSIWAQGVELADDVSVLEAWVMLRSADNFLYLIPRERGVESGPE
ncbi:unnamed protein product [Chrysoparadoxa australica]